MRETRQASSGSADYQETMAWIVPLWWFPDCGFGVGIRASFTCRVQGAWRLFSGKDGGTRLSSDAACPPWSPVTQAFKTNHLNAEAMR